MFDLTGELALVTGARGRLGPVWVAALRAAGAEVIETDTDRAMQGESIFAHCEPNACDITDPAQVERLRCSINSLCGLCGRDEPNHVTILVNNAGVDDRPVIGSAPWPRYDTAEAMLRVNLLGTYICTNTFGQDMVREKKGVIINIASLYGLVAPDLKLYSHLDGFLKHPMYGATKAGIISLTKYFAAMYGPSGVRVNALAPGGVINPADPLTGQDEEFTQEYTAKIPMARMCTPDDLKGPLVFLASKASSFVSGQCLALDGGFCAW